MSDLFYSQEQMLQVRNENYAAGQADELKRIIKLLEDNLKGCSGQDCDECDEYVGIKAAIALIKVDALLIQGENK